MAAIDITRGARPSVNRRVDDSTLHNMYVGNDGFLYRMPSISPEATGVGFVHSVYAASREGRPGHTIFSKNHIFSFDERISAFNKINDINYSSNLARFTINQKKEISIVDSGSLQVYNIDTNTIVKVGDSEGLSLNNPVDISTIDNFTTVVGGTDQEWFVSNFNNSLQFSNDNRVILDASFGLIKAVSRYANNLFIFGEHNIQRWTPSSQVISALDPFEQDNSWSKDVGVFSTKSVAQASPGIFFLSSDHHVRSLGDQGITVHTTPGLAKIFKDNKNSSSATGTIYNYNGYYFYHLHFGKGDNWVLNTANNTWSSVDLDIIGFQNNYALTPTSYGKLVDTFDGGRCTFISKTEYPPEKPGHNYYTLKNILVDIVQGYNSLSTSKLEILVSIDNAEYQSVAVVPMAKAGERNFRLTQDLNLDGYHFSIKINYYGRDSISIIKIEPTFS